MVNWKLNNKLAGKLLYISVKFRNVAINRDNKKGHDKNRGLHILVLTNYCSNLRLFLAAALRPW